MEKITEATIDTINDRIQAMDESGIQEVWDEFARKQPAVIGYVLGESRELQQPDAKEDIAYILTVILLSFGSIDPDIPPVTEPEFEKAFQEAFDEMEDIFHEGFDETDAMNIIESFSQPDLLQFVAAIIYSEREDGEIPNFTDEEAGLFIILFKTVIGLLDNKVE